MWLHRFDVISQSILSGHNNMLYKYYYYELFRYNIMHATFVTLWLKVVQPLANVHETKWTPHVKRQSDVAQSYTSSDLTWFWVHVDSSDLTWFWVHVNSSDLTWFWVHIDSSDLTWFWVHVDSSDLTWFWCMLIALI